MNRPARLAAIALSALGLFAGCGSDAGSEPAPEPGNPATETRRQPSTGAGATQAPGGRLGSEMTAVDRAAIGALVEARAEALADGRPDAYAATSSGGLRRADAADARRARQLGVSSVRIERIGVRVRGRRAFATVRASHRLDGVAGRWRYGQALQLRSTDAGWRVTGLRSRAPRPPWELASYRRFDTRHFSAFLPVGVAAGAGALSDALERAHATVRQRLPGRDGRRYPVIVAEDLTDMRAMTSGIRDVGRLSAITDLSLRTSGPAERVTAVTAARILVPWPSFIALSAEGRERVLTHELAHAVLAPVTSGRAPAWLQEGIALYVSGDQRTSAARAALSEPGGAQAAWTTGLGRLADPNAMAGLAGQDLGAAYALSSSTAYYVAGRFGAQKLLDLLAAFGDEALAGPPGRSLADRVTRRVLGSSVRRLERDVAEWVRAGAPALDG